MRYSAVFIASGIIVAAVQAASAADLAIRPAPSAPLAPVLAAQSWTGFYLGIHAGYGWSNSTVTVTDNFEFFDHTSLDQKGDGVIGGGQIGYNWQFAPNWMVGVEGDVSGTGIRNTINSPVTFNGAPLPFPGFNQQAERDIRWLATVRGRFGYAGGPWLVYVTGGGAWGGIDYTAGPNIGGVYSPIQFSHTSSGWTVGGGFEYAFTPNWSARFEYLYYDLDGASIRNPVITAPGLATTETWDRNKINVVRVGVNYKF